MRLFIQECKNGSKSFFIWTFSMIFVCAGCVLLYTSMKDSVQGIADTYANLGAMSQAFGLDKVSIATIDGYYATEIAIMFNLGSALFAALLGIGMLSKEENGHTSEFLNTLPVSRLYIYCSKYAACAFQLLFFNILIVCGNLLALLTIGEYESKPLFLYHIAAFIMQMELMTVCFMISAFCKKQLTGCGLGIAILLYGADMMCRVIPKIEDCKYITPFYYASGADIYSDVTLNGNLILIGICISIGAFALGLWKYLSKDIAS